MTLREVWNVLRTPVVGRYEPIRRPAYPVDQRLVERQLEAAKWCPTNAIRPLLIEGRK